MSGAATKKIQELEQTTAARRFNAEQVAAQLAAMCRLDDAPFALTLGRELRGAVDRVLGTLPLRERYVLCLRFGLSDPEAAPENVEELTLAELGARLGVTAARVRQLEVRALRTLRKPNRANQLRPFVPPISDPRPVRQLPAVRPATAPPADPAAAQAASEPAVYLPPRRYVSKAEQALQEIRVAEEARRARTTGSKQF